MSNYCIINGVNSNTISGLLIQELPSVQKPKMRTRTETIDGRDGDIVTNLGYEAYDRDMKIGLHGSFNIDEITAFFNTSGEIIFSNEPSKVYTFTMIDDIDYERLGRFREAKVTFHVQPYKYSVAQQTRDVEFEAEDIRSERWLPITIDSSIEDYALLTEFVLLTLQYDEVKFFRVGKNFLSHKHPLLNVRRFVLGQTESYSSPQIYLPKGSYYLSTDYNNSNVLVKIGLYHNGAETFLTNFYSQTANKAFTISEAGYYSIYLYADTQLGSWNSLTQWQLERGESATEFEDYDGEVFTVPNVVLEEPVPISLRVGENNIFSESQVFHILYTNREVTLENTGNVPSKPIITVYGSGNVDLYLNRYQVLQFNIDDNYITLDFEKLNAYTGGVLKNRQVIGDMSAFSLPVGTSSISFSGDVESVQISKWSRYV